MQVEDLSVQAVLLLWHYACSRQTMVLKSNATSYAVASVLDATHFCRFAQIRARKLAEAAAMVNELLLKASKMVTAAMSDDDASPYAVQQLLSQVLDSSLVVHLLCALLIVQSRPFLCVA
jgi:hypothetical protein